MKIAAIYPRVSSDQQKEDNTIGSQTAALVDVPVCCGRAWSGCGILWPKARSIPSSSIRRIG
ncbi:hypothetical protein [Mesorhizobium sp. M1396]|uniref:hypothetical protein n=1 Tax=Mesorhizobium sp. M1396 TaxID=2957095 RepID=UPI00333908AC